MTQWGLDTLFNPAKRHMDEEKRRLQSTREQIGDSSGGKRIDLESGRVTIHRDDADGELTDEPSDEPAGQPDEVVDAKQTPAQARARQRIADRRAKTAKPAKPDKATPDKTTPDKTTPDTD